jgi:hypothetical protein
MGCMDVLVRQVVLGVNRWICGREAVMRGRLRIAVVAALFALSASAQAADAVDPDVAAVLRNWSLPVPTPNRIVVCHGYNCLFRTEITLTGADHARFAAFLAAGAGSPQAERKQLGHLEAWYEKRVAPIAGTASAKARAGGGFHIGGTRGQFDCVDTTANTTSLLVVLSQLKLLRHHKVSTPISRLLTGGGPHFTATIQEIRGGAKWTVDPWPHDNGQYPDIIAAERWLDGKGT